MGCGTSSTAHTVSLYDQWPPRDKPYEEGPDGRRKWLMPTNMDSDFIEKYMADKRTLTHLHASSSVAYEAQKTAHFHSKDDGMRCKSAWVTKAGEDCGVQKLNQDCALAAGSFNGRGDALFGVFDGHGPNGHHASHFVREHMQRCLQRYLKDFDAVEALQRAFADVQKGLEQQGDFATDMSGTTAVVAHLRGRQLTVAWVGDSRAVLGRSLPEGGSCAAVQLTADHKPSCPAEAARILSKGGRVERIHGDDGEDIGPLRVWLRHIWMPGLAMTRALGDGIARRAGVIAQPEVCSVQLARGDEFLVIGSDGLFELLENQEIVDAVRGCPGTEEACALVVERASERWKEVEYGCADDITAVIVRFRTRQEGNDSP